MVCFTDEVEDSYVDRTYVCSLELIRIKGDISSE